MAQALYGPGGFYVASGSPARHFRTSAHTSHLWAQCWLRAAQAVYDSLDVEHRSAFSVVDVGAGGGELLAALAAAAPACWQLVGVDVAPRPVGLPPAVQWRREPPESIVGVCLAVELLDVVPVDVVELSADGPRIVEVSFDGDEQLGRPVDAREQTWLDRWWPLAEIGDRAELGGPREDVWRALVDRMRAGVAVAVDYAVDPARDLAGTLAGYRDGRQIRPRPDGSADITAHVRMPSCAGPGAELVRQRDALHRLGLDGRIPPYDGDPGTYARALAEASAAAELLDPDGLGGFTWLVEGAGGARLWPMAAMADSPP
jgi:SAM-dependent MidA family methyltransferase